MSGDYVAHSMPRVDAVAKVIGEAEFPGDLSVSGMAHMKVLFARHPYARIRCINTVRAEAAPGVLAVLTARDVPVNNYGISQYDQPVLCDKVVRYVGDRVALVVAETEKAATQARALIEVEYEELPVVDSPETARLPDARLVHPEKDTNVLATFRIHKRRPRGWFCSSRRNHRRDILAWWTGACLLAARCRLGLD